MIDEAQWYVVVGVVRLVPVALAAAWVGCWLDNKRFSVRPLGTLRSLPILAGAVLAVLVPPQLSWLGALTGASLIAGSSAMLWAPEISHHAMFRRRSRAPWTHLDDAARALARPRHSPHMGRAVMAVGVGLLGGSPYYLAIAVAFLIAEAVSAALSERTFRVAGRHGRMATPFWDAKASLFVFAALTAAASTGGVLDGRLTWVAPGAHEGPALLFQALLATNVAIAAIGVATTGIVLQIRSAGFGTEIAWQVLPRWRLLIAAALMTTSAMLNIWLLGRWDSADRDTSSLLPSIAVQLSIIAIAHAAWAAGAAVWSLIQDKSLLDLIERRVARAGWADEVRGYGWNAHRESQLPESLRLLERSLIGAMRQSDIGLFDALVSRWADAASEQSPIVELVRPAGDWRQRHAAQHDARPDANTAAFFDGLDIGLSHACSALARRPDFAEYLPRLTPMLEIVYPAVGPAQPLYGGLSPSPPPGLRFLRALAAQATDANDLASNRIVHRWQECIELAVVWAEREWSDGSDEVQRASVYAERAFESLAALAEPGPAPSEARKWVVPVILAGVNAAHHSRTIIVGLSVIDGLAPYRDAQWAFEFEMMARVARKADAPTARMMSMFERSVDGIIEGTPAPLIRPEFTRMGAWWSAMLEGIADPDQGASENAGVHSSRGIEEQGVAAITRLAGDLLASKAHLPASDAYFGQRAVVHELLGFLSPTPRSVQELVLAYVREWAESDDGRSWAADACERYEARSGV